ncbi:MAG: cytochrome c-type biogenesis protein [Rhodospirillaceae bacterium]
MKLRNCLFALVLAVTAPLLHAGEAAPAAEDPVLEKRVMALAHELRCLVCQNQTIADSNAGLAVDLRNEVREKMREGQSNEEIVQYLTARYGDFVLYRPPIKLATLILWFGPLLLLLWGLYALFRRLRDRSAAPVEPLTEEERRRAAALLAEGDGGST